MQILRILVFGTTFIYLSLVLADWVFAKPRDIHRAKPIPQSQVQIDPNVLQEHQKRFGQSAIGNRYLNRTRSNVAPLPQIVNTPVTQPTEDSLFELPVLPQTVGDYPYKPRYPWGRQRTLGELLRADNKSKTGPQKELDLEAQEERAFKEAYKKVYGPGTKTQLEPKK
jgi:hypothetical protein